MRGCQRGALTKAITISIQHDGTVSGEMAVKYAMRFDGIKIALNSLILLLR
jgi:hypothetical protein